MLNHEKLKHSEVYMEELCEAQRDEINRLLGKLVAIGLLRCGCSWRQTDGGHWNGCIVPELEKILA